ncbi:Trk system potassium transporter TrkA [Candidatus Formimonas warabiya]|nr:Trk system potassium transporter TrkA [Candidatus Formimonas warabiya]
MKSIIVGAGKVGYSIAQMLSSEGHDVIVIEIDPTRLHTVEEHLDVQTICGNGANPSVLKEAGVEESDLLAAVTELDELNIVSCLLAKSLGVKRTIARVREPEYVDLDQMTQKNALGIDLIINPERVTAHEIAKLITKPEAQIVEYFAGGKVQLLELKMMENSPVCNLELKYLECPQQFLIAAILREGKVIIPRGKDMIKVGDMIFVLAQTKEMGEVERFFGQRRTRMQNVVILGGGRIGYYLAQLLEHKHMNVKIIEKDFNQCQFIAQNLHRCLVIHGDGTDLQLLEDENVGATDLFVAVTGDDKINLLVSLLAKHLGTKKTIAQIRRSDYTPLVEKVGIDRAVSPRKLAASAILRFVRKGKIVSVTLLNDAQAEMMELIVPESYRYAGKCLKDVGFPSGAIIGALVQENKIIIPRGRDIVCPGDRVIVFALPNSIQKIEQFFS